MTTPNTTARQAGLTDEQIADAIPLTAMIVYGAVSGDPKTVRMNLGELREFAANILAAQSADASIYQELDPSGLWEDISKERFDELKIRSDVRVRAFGQSADARNGEGVTLTPEDMEPMLVAANVPVEVWEEVMDFAAMLLAAPAAPAPKLTPHAADVEQMLDSDEAAPTDGFSAAVHQVRGALELCEPEDLAAFDFIMTAITPPAPAAQAERKPIGYMNERAVSILAQGSVMCTHVSPTKTEFQQVAIYKDES